MATASLELVLQAVQLSRSVDQAMVRAALLFLQLDSVFGPVRFSLEGDNAGTEPLVVQNEQVRHSGGPSRGERRIKSVPSVSDFHEFSPTYPF